MRTAEGVWEGRREGGSSNRLRSRLRRRQYQPGIPPDRIRQLHPRPAPQAHVIRTAGTSCVTAVCRRHPALPTETRTSVLSADVTRPIRQRLARQHCLPTSPGPAYTSLSAADVTQFTRRRVTRQCSLLTSYRPSSTSVLSPDIT